MLFLFVDYEGARTRQGTTFNSNVPTLHHLAGNFAGGRAIFDPATTRANPANPSQFIRTAFPGNFIPPNRQSPQALYFKSRFPTQNGPSLFVYSPPLLLDTDKFDVKISPRLTERQPCQPLLVCRQYEQDQQGYPVLGYYPLHSRAQNAGLSYLHIFSPAVTRELTFNYYRSYFLLLNMSGFNGQDVASKAGITGFEGISNLQPAAASIALSGYTALAGSTDNRPKANRIRTYQYRSALTWVHRTHFLKFGAQLSIKRIRLSRTRLARIIQL